jgi:serine/threonine kinase PknH
MSQRRGSKRGSDWKPPRDRREIVIAVLASLSVIVVTAALLWFLRPNRNSGSTSTTNTIATVPSSTTVAGETTTAPATTVAPTTAPATTSTP